MAHRTSSNKLMNDPRTRGAFRRIVILFGGYLVLSALTVLAAFILRDGAVPMSRSVWIRGSVALASAIILLLSALSAARGSAPAYLRMRLISAIAVVPIVVVITIPDSIPVLMKIEQGICGLFLIGVVAIVNSRHLREAFGRETRPLQD
jgi:heme/copper-type cytochrome/quinol oxidase subunit 4